ncbi:uncharacterized protein ARMOST_15083 [Armillaria ostoyae]|uniref:Uncharacterized protein n=1 Tax=Armillaria ostoyae TaxID=47428 RepID=A0A284RSE7_ARMOS|nr:uncharacterized protein ARMOST_15083 [Armillaria ostoyae]
MASIELEDLIKQSVTQLNRKLTVEKERDNCIILSSTGFGRGKAMPNGRSVVQNASLIRSINVSWKDILALRRYWHALLAKNIIRHSATTTITRTVVPSTKTFIVMLTGLVTGGGTGIYDCEALRRKLSQGIHHWAKAGRARTSRSVSLQVSQSSLSHGRTDEGRVKTRVRHIKEIDGKIDTLVIKFCLIHWVPLFRLHHKKFAAEDPLEPQTVQDRRVGIFALNVIAPVLRNTCLLIDPRQRSTVPPSRHINVSSVAEDEQQVAYGPTKAKLTFVLATNKLCWEDSGERTGPWSEQLSAEVLEKSILGLVTPIRQGVMTRSGDDGGLFSLPQLWVNNVNFFHPGTGVDPIIGSAGNYWSRLTRAITLQHYFVVSRGGEYFFASVSTILNIIAT